MMNPATRPKQDRATTAQIIEKAGISPGRVALLAIRGYYRDTMGKEGVNDRGIYDDAIFIISPAVYKTFNANTDPQKYGRRLAMLKPGHYAFYRGKHKGSAKYGYNALRAYPEGVELPCTRDGVDSTCSYINIHKGGYRDTFSAGCITLPPSQWSEFIRTVYAEMDRLNQPVINLILKENK
jgi:lysozyme